MKKIAIIGSTGSIGKSLLSILQKENNYEIKLLTTNKSYKLLLKQAEKFKVKNLIIIDQKNYNKAIKLNKNGKFKIYNNFNCLIKFFKKIDYVMSSIMGIVGLEPTVKIIKFTKKIILQIRDL